MKVSTFQWTPEMETDPEAMEVAWNNWISELRAIGFQPSEDPVSYTDLSATYVLLAASGIRAFSETTMAPRAALAVVA